MTEDWVMAEDWVLAFRVLRDVTDEYDLPCEEARVSAMVGLQDMSADKLLAVYPGEVFRALCDGLLL